MGLILVMTSIAVSAIHFKERNIMGQCSVEFKELRFVIEPELTQCYALINAVGDCPLGLQGWHHKTFPASVSTQDILAKIGDGSEDPIMWAQQAPG